MTAAEAVRARLLELPGLVAVVGSRIYVLTFPQSPVWPAIRVTQVSEGEDYHGRGSIGFRRARVQIDVVATTYIEASETLALAHGSYSEGAATGLSGFRGLAAGLPVAGIFAEGRRDLYDATEPATVRLSRDYGVYWRQA